MIESNSWTIQKIIHWTTGHFASRDIESSRLDAEILLASVLKCRRIDLYLKFDQPLKNDELNQFRELIKRRSKKEPVAYILGEKEFYGRDFSVGPGVLVPRPETEHLIDETLKWANSKPNALQEILDIGSGSGCIGVTLAKELVNVKVTAIDSSSAAIDFTKKNAEKWGVVDRMIIEEVNFETMPTPSYQYDAVVSNPPYVAGRVKDSLAKEVLDFEPSEALFGGPSGHEKLSLWIPRMLDVLKAGGFFACEIGYDQREIAKNTLDATRLCQDAKVISDYSGNARIIIGTKV